MGGRLVKEIMHRDLITCLTTTTVATVARRMVAHKVQALIVVDDAGYAIGIISQTDVILAHQGRTGAALACMRAGDIMTPDPITCTPDAPISEAITVMTSNCIHRLLVVKPGESRLYPLGVISMADVMQHMIGDLPMTNQR